jgi:hypothetical protein
VVMPYLVAPGRASATGWLRQYFNDRVTARGSSSRQRGYISLGQGVLASLRAGPLIATMMVAVASGPLAAKEHRSRDVTREFQREQPCPSTGRASGACPGYRKDHIVPLACGGPDAVSNLQWQTVAEARAKDRWKRRVCAR